MYNTDLKRPEKQKLLNSWLGNSSKPAKRFLTLPSSSGMCVKTAKEFGAIDSKTHLYYVEKTKKEVYCDNELREPDIQRERLERCFYKEQFDLVFCDICSQVNAEFLWWLKNLKLTKNSKIGFTFYSMPRGAGTFYQSLLKQKYRNPARVTSGLHRETDTQYIYELCDAIALVRPDIKFNITWKYNEPGNATKMIFLGGYTGSAPAIMFRTNRKENPMTTFEKIENRLSEFKKNGTPKAQQLGGFKIMWNRLSPQKRGAYKRNKQFKSIITKMGL